MRIFIDFRFQWSLSDPDVRRGLCFYRKFRLLLSGRPYGAIFFRRYILLLTERPYGAYHCFMLDF